MDRQFPNEFKQLMRAPDVKAAFVSEIESPNPNACQNCGGSGSVCIFIATVGPLNSPVGGKLVSHYADDKWWGGSNFVFACPVCRKRL